jgi:PleD family two-component response regulator
MLSRGANIPVNTSFYNKMLDESEPEADQIEINFLQLNSKNIQRRILIVDDEAFNLIGLRNLMKTI